MIDRETKSVVIVDRDGKALARIAQKGAGYEFDNPVDLTYDAFGQIYVLDRGRASVFVFGPRNRLLTTITMPEKSPGAFPRASAFGLGKEPEARADFVALLKADPVYTLTGQVSPRVVAIFDEVMKATVTTMRLAVMPPTAEVRVDGVIVPATTTMPIAIGDHSITARQVGYRAVTQSAPIGAGQMNDITIALERVSSVLAALHRPARLH